MDRICSFYGAFGAVRYQPAPPRTYSIWRAGAYSPCPLLAVARRAVPSLSPTRPPTEL